MKEQKHESAYKKAGVDIDEAAELVERIKPAIKRTNRSGVMGGIGGFGAMFDPKAAGYNDPILVSSTDGVGTKIKIAIDCDVHNTIGIDAVAMCVNDLVVQGAEPLFFLDYFATGKLRNAVAQDVIESVAKGCEISGCALIGGETAEMPGLYAEGDYDLAGFTVGAVDRSALITGESIQTGDVVFGLASNGVHSNGYSLVRKLIRDAGLSYEASAPFDMDIRMQDADPKAGTTRKAATILEAMLSPTRIYVKQLLAAFKIKSADGKPAIRGLAHITGGGLSENIPRVIPAHITLRIDAKSWTLPPVFSWLKGLGNIDSADLARTLNCGIGMVVICDKAKADEVEALLREHGEIVYRLGVAENRSAEALVIDNLDSAWA